MTSSTILCLGNNDINTDYLVTDLASQNQSINHGLVDDPEFVPLNPGYYHTTVVDVPWGKLTILAQRFDLVIMLDQDQSQWSHWKCLEATYKFMVELEKIGHPVNFRNNANAKKFIYWSELLTEKNKSFCIYPWINMFTDNQNLRLCGRSNPTITTLDRLTDWKTDPNYTEIRQKMLAGEKLPDHCKDCYKYEDHQIESYRQFETMDWVTQLNLSTVEDLEKITQPYFYEVHAGDTCNIKCRGCTPGYSRAIEVESKKFNIISPMPPRSGVSNQPIQHINIDTLTPDSTVYFQGGEPTIMPEVFDFLSRCVKKNKTDFNLTMCTNGVKLSPKFIDLVNQFSKVNFSFSIDAYGKINDYWRSGSQWNRVIDHAHLLESYGHSISINTVPGIYNVTNLHLLFEFLDQEFPFTAIYLQLNYYNWQSAFNHPNSELVLDSLKKCMKTSIYKSNGKSCKSGIDALYEHYSKNPKFSVEDLKKFFDYNDQLDRARGVKLADYIPELEDCRKYIL